MEQGCSSNTLFKDYFTPLDETDRLVRRCGSCLPLSVADEAMTCARATI